jgi:hypothetical protein
MRGDGAVPGPIGNSPLQGTREEGWVRREREREREKKGSLLWG